MRISFRFRSSFRRYA